MRVKPLAITGSLIWFGIPTLLLWAAVTKLIPYLIGKGFHGLYAWYVSGGAVFIAMFAAAFLGAGKSDRLKRLRLSRPSKDDLKLTGINILITFSLMGVVYFLLETFTTSPESMMPPFLEGTVIQGQNRLLLFLAWLPLFFFNIVGEEVLWRGYLLPRQELKFGRHAWLVNGILWIVFHIPFGLRTILMVAPLFFLLPRLAQKTQNTWPGIIIHALVNGPAFAAILLGLI